MPFDSFMASALTFELNTLLCGIKVDKVCQPERDEVDLIFHRPGRNRLVINCTASTPYMALSEQSRENPQQPPMMCMLLRKHLTRAKITSIEQPSFDRIIRILFDSGDEMGFFKQKYLYCEMMGRGSNLIFADENHKILAAFRQNDLTTKFERVVMAGFPYQPMPAQDKTDPILCTRETFLDLIKGADPELRADLFLQRVFGGFGKLTAKEVVFLAASDPEALLKNISPDAFWQSFSSLCDRIRNSSFEPCLIYESKEDFLSGADPVDFSFMPIRQFAAPFYVHPCSSVSECIEQYYLTRNQNERQKQHYNDIYQMIKNCKNRLQKKIEAQKLQIEDAADAEKDKKYGDLIMQEMYRIRKGDKSVLARDWTSDAFSEIEIPLSETLSPSQNAQRYYKEYNKKKTAVKKLGEQIAIAREELLYANSIEASLSHSVTAQDLRQIREELSHWNYGRRLLSGLKKPHTKKEKARPKEFLSPNGLTCFVGMNNLQNDTVSTELVQKEDLWFHVKNYHGSHVLLKKRNAEEFKDEDVVFAASLAARYSEVSDSDRVEVDYTFGSFLKKPNGSKPGFVTYKKHYTMIVSPLKSAESLVK